MPPFSARGLPGSVLRRRPDYWLLIAGAAAFALVMASYLAYKYTHTWAWTMDPVDLYVYRSGGLIVRHVRPTYNPHLAAPLYDWPGYTALKLKFTYPPFAAVAFALASFVPWYLLPRLVVVANVGLLVLTLWFTFGGLGYRSRALRLGAALLTAAAVFWTEPVVRTMYLGQVNLALLALIMWDLCQPDYRRWKGAGVGIAAGIKMIPLIFIPYLLVTRRFRQAGVACAAFAATVLAGFVFLPADSAKWWFGGLFFNGGRTGFIAWSGNQSLRGLVARLLGSVAGSADAWLILAVLTVVAGLVCAALLDRKGHRMAGLLAAALTGLLASPVSWDHHWVWIVPAVAVAAHYAVTAMRDTARRALGDAAGQRPASWPELNAQAQEWITSRAGWACWAIVAVTLAVFGAYPGWLLGHRRDLGEFSLGLLWMERQTGLSTYNKFGDRPRYAEYHWHGIQLLIGNAYVLYGLAALGLLLLVALLAPGPRPAVAATPAERPDLEGATAAGA